MYRRPFPFFSAFSFPLLESFSNLPLKPIQVAGSCAVCPLIPGARTSADAGKQRQIVQSGRSLSATCCDIGLYQFRHLGINPAIQ